MNEQEFSHLRKQVKWIFVILGVVILLALLIVTVAQAGLLSTKQKLPRDEVYYEIDNDNGDHGNFIETYHVPNGRGGKVYCIVYSDKIGKSGGGAGISCDWENSR